MANTKQATKRARQALKRRTNNRQQLSRLRTHIKKVLSLISAKDYEAASSSYRSMTSLTDRAASKGLIHKNKASRTKSRVNARLKALWMEQKVSA